MRHGHSGHELLGALGLRVGFCQERPAKRQKVEDRGPEIFDVRNVVEFWEIWAFSVVRVKVKEVKEFRRRSQLTTEGDRAGDRGTDSDPPSLQLLCSFLSVTAQFRSSSAYSSQATSGLGSFRPSKT